MPHVGGMGRPGATLGSITSHAGKPFSPGIGSPNILIGKKPALRVLLDFHFCPLSDWFKPHVGGVVLKGSSTVFYNKMPAVRAGDSNCGVWKSKHYSKRR